jgi:glycosyltransferase involved in cell wall biosynthesis
MQREVPRAGIAVGICTKNCEKTIRNVMEIADEGLSRFYPGRKALIIVSDLSNDSTERRASGTKTNAPVFFTRQEGGPGKGNAIKTIFRLAEKSGARMVALVDGDLTSIRPEWIKALLEPVHQGYDLAVPFYHRHKYDAIITNHIMYPFVTSLYGTEIRQPIGGEFGLSLSLIRKLLRHPRFPEGFGIDIFITTTALAEGMRVAETTLGVKSHTSTETYIDFSKLLVPMFNQVVSTLFDLTLYNRDKIKDVRDVKKVKRFEFVDDRHIEEFNVDRNVLFRIFQRDYERMMESDVLSEETKSQISNVISGSAGKRISRRLWKNAVKDIVNYSRDRVRGRKDRAMRPDILSEETKNEIRHFIYGESAQIISVETWVNSIFDVFRSYMHPGKRHESIDVLRAVWMGRFSSFVRQTRFMNNTDAECMIRGQVDVFNEKRAGFLRGF